MLSEANFRLRLGERIRELRKEKDISQQELAALCNMEKENISRLESGKHSPNSYTLYIIATALKVQMSDLFIIFI